MVRGRSEYAQSWGRRAPSASTRSVRPGSRLADIGSRQVALVAAGGGRMQERERIARQVLQRHADNLPRASQPGVPVADGALRLQARAAEPVVEQREPLTA